MADVEPSWLRGLEASKEDRTWQRMVINLHRIKYFHRGTGRSNTPETRPLLWGETPVSPSGRSVCHRSSEALESPTAAAKAESLKPASVGHFVEFSRRAKKGTI